MTCNELWKILKKDGWYVLRRGKGAHVILAHPTKTNQFPFSDHGSKEVAKGTEQAILKLAGLK